MTVAIHPVPTPPVSPRVLKAVAAAVGAACLALAAFGVANVADQTPAGSATTNAPAITAPVQGADMSDYRAYAEENGLTGLSPASAGPITAPDRVDLSDFFAYEHGVGIPAVDGATGVAVSDFFAYEHGVGTQQSDESSDDLVPARSNFASDADWIASFTTDGQTTDGSHRGNFASDIDWLAANGMIE